MFFFHGPSSNPIYHTHPRKQDERIVYLNCTFIIPTRTFDISSSRLYFISQHEIMQPLTNFFPTKTPHRSCDFWCHTNDLWSIKHVQLRNGFAGLQIWQKVSWSTTLRRPWSFASSQEKDSPNTEPSMGGDPLHHQACLRYDVLESQTLWRPKTISRLLIPCFGENLIQLQRDICIRLIIQFPFQFSSLPCKICCGPQHL